MSGRLGGRRAEPVEKKIAKGARGAKKLAEMTPARVEGMPERPQWLRDHALTCWERVSGLLFMRGQLSADSEISLIALCQCYAEWVELSEDIRTNGRFQCVTTTSGDMMERPRPILLTFADCDRRLRGWLNEFGLTDASRGKVSTAGKDPADEDDPLAKYGLN